MAFLNGWGGVNPSNPSIVILTPAVSDAQPFTRYTFGPRSMVLNFSTGTSPVSYVILVSGSTGRPSVRNVLQRELTPANRTGIKSNRVSSARLGSRTKTS